MTLTPETTGGRDGFIHLHEMTGGAASARLQFILRDFEQDGLRAQGALLRQVCAALQATEPRARIDLHDHAAIPQHALLAGTRHAPGRAGPRGLPADRHRALLHAIRGGTDGSRLTELGVPTPNLFTGMQTIHGPLEWVCLQDMARATELCVELVQLWSGVARPASTVGEANAPADGNGAVDWVG